MTGNVKVTEGWLSSLNSIKFNHSLHYRHLCVGKLMNSLFATCSRAVRTQTKIVLIVFGSFLKQLLPQIIHFHGIFLINQPIWGCPHDYGNPHFNGADCLGKAKPTGYSGFHKVKVSWVIEVPLKHPFIDWFSNIYHPFLGVPMTMETPQYTGTQVLCSRITNGSSSLKGPGGKQTCHFTTLVGRSKWFKMNIHIYIYKIVAP